MCLIKLQFPWCPEVIQQSNYTAVDIVSSNEVYVLGENWICMPSFLEKKWYWPENFSAFCKILHILNLSFPCHWVGADVEVDMVICWEMVAGGTGGGNISTNLSLWPDACYEFDLNTMNV
jgi:hypothetical protein